MGGNLRNGAHAHRVASDQGKELCLALGLVGWSSHVGVDSMANKVMPGLHSNQACHCNGRREWGEDAAPGGEREDSAGAYT